MEDARRHPLVPPLLCTGALAAALLAPLVGCAGAEAPETETPVEERVPPEEDDGEKDGGERGEGEKDLPPEDETEGDGSPDVELGVSRLPQIDEAPAEGQALYGQIAVSADDGYDYFFSSNEYALCRARPGVPGAEVVLPLPDPIYSGEYMTFLVVDGDRIFYVREGSHDSAGIWSVRTDGSDNRLLRHLGGAAARPTCMAVVGDRLYAVMPKTNEQTGDQYAEIFSMSLESQGWRTEGAVDGFVTWESAFLTTESAYLSLDPTYSSDVERACILRFDLRDGSTSVVYESELDTIEYITPSDRGIVLHERTSSADGGPERQVLLPWGGGEAEELQSASYVMAGDDALTFVRDESYDPSTGPYEFMGRWSLQSTPMLGGEPTVLLDEFYAEWPMLNVMGDHYVLYDAGHQMPDIGRNVISLTPGRGTATYAGKGPGEIAAEHGTSG